MLVIPLTVCPIATVVWNLASFTVCPSVFPNPPLSEICGRLGGSWLPVHRSSHQVCLNKSQFASREEACTCLKPFMVHTWCYKWGLWSSKRSAQPQQVENEFCVCVCVLLIVVVLLWRHTTHNSAKYNLILKHYFSTFKIHYSCYQLDLLCIKLFGTQRPPEYKEFMCKKTITVKIKSFLTLSWCVTHAVINSPWQSLLFII